METTFIENALKKYSDQSLANLQCAAEDGRLKFRKCDQCLLHYHEGTYALTRHNQWAFKAEVEFVKLGWNGKYEDATKDPETDARRRERILPLIHAEWARRAQPVPVTFETPEKVEVTR